MTMTNEGKRRITPLAATTPLGVESPTGLTLDALADRLEQTDPALRKKQYHRGYRIEIASREDPPGVWRSRWTALMLGAVDTQLKSDYVAQLFPAESKADEAALRAACAWIDSFGKR